MGKRKGSHRSSILTGAAKCCYKTGRTEGLDKHHIYHGNGLRAISDKHGFWVYLWQPLHIAGLDGLHAHPNKGLDLELKQDCQRAFEQTHSREEFMAIIGRNYLGDDDEETAEIPQDGFFLLGGVEADGEEGI